MVEHKRPLLILCISVLNPRVDHSQQGLCCFTFSPSHLFPECFHSGNKQMKGSLLLPFLYKYGHVKLLFYHLPFLLLYSKHFPANNSTAAHQIPSSFPLLPLPCLPFPSELFSAALTHGATHSLNRYGYLGCL